MLQDRKARLGVVARFLRALGYPFFLIIVLVIFLSQQATHAFTKTTSALRPQKPHASLHSMLRDLLLRLYLLWIRLRAAALALSKLASKLRRRVHIPAAYQILRLLGHNSLSVFFAFTRSLPSPHIPTLRIGKPAWFRLPTLPEMPRFNWSRLRVPRVGPMASFLFAFAGLIIGGSVVFYVTIWRDLPHPSELVTQPRAMTTKIYDRNQRLLYKVFQDENRSLVTLEELPDYVVQATLAIEDAEFYTHAGFSVRGIMRAIRSNASSNSLQGGSTITQQLVKNVLLSPERTYTRKLKELVLALQVESFFTKDEILNMYLNQVGYGGTAYGIEEAAQYYFDKSAWELSLPEAALLAGLPQAPTTYSPFGARPELALERQVQVLNRMRDEGYISESLAEKAAAVKLSFASPKSDIEAPHFVMFVRDQLAQTYGEDTVNQGGLEVVTSLDRDIQALAETAINEELDRLASLNVTNAAAMVTDPATGDVLAMVGSRDYFDSDHDGQVNVALRQRQPGSSIKPVTYALALEHGDSAGTLLVDQPVTYAIAGSQPYSPKNYDGRFHGTVTIRQALANSYNIPAVITLHKHGVDPMIDLAESMGITTWRDRSRFGLALTLGGGEVTLYDMMSVYGTFANYGYHVPLRPLITIHDFTGSTMEDFDCETTRGTLASFPQARAHTNTTCPGEQVLSPASAYIISDILSDNRARTPSFGANSVLNIPGQQVAVKTGTTNSLRDNWTLGYTGDYVVGVWVGNNDNTPMSRVASGITGASPIWSTIMTALMSHTGYAHQFDAPDDLISVDYCPLTNTLSCRACPNPTKEVFARGHEPTSRCTNEQVARLLQPTPAQN